MRPKKKKTDFRKKTVKNRFPLNEKEMVAKVNELIEPICEAEGMELVHVEYQREANGRILRLYIDHPEGITLDDCVHISRQADDILDIYLESYGFKEGRPYNLEVSSPGTNRPLGKEKDFERFKGNEVKIKIASSVNGEKTGKHKTIRGTLLGISDGNVRISLVSETVTIPFQEIVRARLVNYNGENKC
jgi:ribosome maturation factor RimP